MNETIVVKCSRCHSHSCIDDHKICEKCRIYRRQHYIDNQESEKARSKEYRAVNKEVLAERAKLYRLKTLEAKAAYSKIYRQIVITCPCCNIDIKKCKKSVHDKTKKHLDNLNLFEKAHVVV